MNKLYGVAAYAMVLVALFAGGQQETSKDETVDRDEKAIFRTVGPNGEEAVDYSKIMLSEQQTKEIQGRAAKVALLMHTSSDWTNAVLKGAEDTFARLEMEVVAVTDAMFDSGQQRTDVETVLALNPDVIVTLVVDPVSGAVALKQAIDRGVKIVLISNLPSGFVHQRDYASIVTDDLFQMGQSVAQMMGDNLTGEVALLYHDADYYVTNQRDQAVESVLRSRYPELKIVARRGIANPQEADILASALLTQFPNLAAIYAPWDTIAEGVVVAARAAKRDELAVFTMDLGANNVLDMVKGGNVRGIVADLPYRLGETLAKVGALSLLGVETPPFITVPAIKVDRNNVKTGWQESLQQPLPPSVAKLLP